MASDRRTLPTIPAIQGVQDKEAEKILRKIKDLLDRFAGVTGNGLDAAVLQSTVGASVQTEIDGGGITLPPATGGGYDPASDTSAPPQPAGLQANGAIKSVILQWTPPDYLNHAFTEVWRDTVDVLDPGGATQLVGTAAGSVFTDETAVRGVVYFYWIRFVSQADPSITGPWNAGSGGGETTQLAQAGVGELAVATIIAGDGVIGNLAVDTAQIAQAAIGDLQIDHATANRIVIATADISLAAITTALIQNAAITNAKIGVAAVQTANIADANVDTLKVAGDAITAAGSGTLTVVQRADDTGGASTPWTDAVSFSINAGNSGVNVQRLFASAQMILEVFDNGGNWGVTGAVETKLIIDGTSGPTLSSPNITYGGSSTGGNLMQRFVASPSFSKPNSSTGNVTIQLQFRFRVDSGNSNPNYYINAEIGTTLYSIGTKR